MTVPRTVVEALRVGHLSREDLIGLGEVLRGARTARTGPGGCAGRGGGLGRQGAMSVPRRGVEDLRVGLSAHPDRQVRTGVPVARTGSDDLVSCAAPVSCAAKGVAR